MNLDAVHASPAMSGQKGGMNIYDASSKTRKGSGPQFFHVHGENDQIHIMSYQGVADGMVQRLRFRVGRATEMVMGDSFSSGVIKGAGTAIVADHGCRFRPQYACPAAVNNGLHVASVM